MGRFAKKRLTAEERAAIRVKKHQHLRQIKQSYLHKELLHGEFFHAGDATLADFLKLLPTKTTPFLAACNERHIKKIEALGHKALWQVDRTVDRDDLMLGKIYRKPDAEGELDTFNFKPKLQGAFICERLQKQDNLFNYLVALREAVAVDAPVAIVVPNAHHELVNDHVNLFTAGTLVYNLVRAGWNCKHATVTFDGRFINVLTRRVDIPEPWPSKVDDLNPYVPFKNMFNFCTSEIAEVYRRRIGGPNGVRWS